MAIELAVALTTLLVEDEHLVALDQRREDLTHDLGTSYSGGTYSHGTILIDEEYLVKLYRCATLSALDVMDKQATTLLYIELLSLNVYDDVHYVSITIKKLAP